MEAKEIFKLSQQELQLRNIFYMEERTVYDGSNMQTIKGDFDIFNPLDLRIIDRNYNFYLSSNELSQKLQNTKYGIDWKAIYRDLNEPLIYMDKELFDLLIDVKDWTSSIVEVSVDTRYSYLSVNRSDIIELLNVE